MEFEDSILIAILSFKLKCLRTIQPGTTTCPASFLQHDFFQLHFEHYVVTVFSPAAVRYEVDTKAVASTLWQAESIQLSRMQLSSHGCYQFLV